MKRITRSALWRGAVGLMAVVMLIGGLPLLTASAASVSDMEAEIKALEKEAAKWADKIKDSKSEKADAETQKAYLDKQIASVE